MLVFDTDIEITEYLKKNIKMLKDFCSRLEILTIAQVLNFEDEIVRSTDVDKAQDLTKSDSISDFKRSVNRMKECKELFRLARGKNCAIMDGLKTAYSTAYYRLLLLLKTIFYLHPIWIN